MCSIGEGTSTTSFTITDSNGISSPGPYPASDSLTLNIQVNTPGNTPNGECFLFVFCSNTPTVSVYANGILLSNSVLLDTNGVGSFTVPRQNGYLNLASGQVEFTIALAAIVKGVPGGLGAGIFWWGTEYVHLNGYNLASFDKTSFFDFDGNTLPVTTSYGLLAAPIKLQAALSNNGVSLQWPLSGAGMKLTQKTNLTPGTAWITVTNPVQSTGTSFNTTLPLGTSPASFYRLQGN